MLIVNNPHPVNSKEWWEWLEKAVEDMPERKENPDLSGRWRRKANNHEVIVTVIDEEHVWIDFDQFHSHKVKHKYTVEHLLKHYYR